MVVAREIPFNSLCMHHMLPFAGVAHVAYIPDDHIVGLSKLARVVELFARRLQVQEGLTTQIANCLQEKPGAERCRGGPGGRAHVYDPARDPESPGPAQSRRPCWARCVRTPAPARSFCR